MAQKALVNVKEAKKAAVTSNDMTRCQLQIESQPQAERTSYHTCVSDLISGEQLPH